MNCVLELRKRLDMTQVDFAQVAGRKYPSIRDYERGFAVPREVADKLASVAEEHGWLDIALELRAPFEAPTQDPPGKSASSRPAMCSLSRADRDRLHGLLDEVFNSGDPDATSTVVANIEVFARFVRSRRRRPAREPKGA